MSSKWQNLLSCMLLHMILPLIPIIIEYLITKNVSPKNLLLATSMYSITVVVQSTNQALFSVGIVLSLLFGMAYGFYEDNPSIDINKYSVFTIGFIFILHFLERVYIHLIKRQPFFKFRSHEVV